MFRVEDDADQLQQALSDVVRALGSLRPGTTPRGQPVIDGLARLEEAAHGRS